MTTAVVDGGRPVAKVRPFIISSSKSESPDGSTASCASQLCSDMSSTRQTCTSKTVNDNKTCLASGTSSTVAVSGTAGAQPSSTVSRSCQWYRVDDVGLSSCSFYHGPISLAEAKVRLQGRPSGTFLLRDSRSGQFPFALSVRTERRGHVTSVRIARRTDTGEYRLDCDDSHRPSMPSFSSVIALVQHFSQSDDHPGGRCKLVSGNGRPDTPLTLIRPLEVTAMTPAPETES